MPPKTPFPAHDIGIIVGLDLVGDALIKLPLLRTLREVWPEAKIHWITSLGKTAYNGPLREVTRHLIDVIHEKPTWLSTTQKRNPAGAAPFFDLLIDTRGRWKEARLARRAPHGLFLAPAFRFLFSDRRPSLFEKRPPHMVDRLLQLVELAASYAPQATGRLPVPDDLLVKARRLMPEGRVYVGLAPGAGNRAKVWPLSRYIDLAALQAAKGRVPVFLLGPDENDWHSDIETTIPQAIFPLQDRAAWDNTPMSIEQTLAIGSFLSVAVANDSGTGHMLAAIDCPLISLFGPTSPAKLAPRVSRGLVIKAQDFGGESMTHIGLQCVEKAIENVI